MCKNKTRSTWPLWKTSPNCLLLTDDWLIHTSHYPMFLLTTDIHMRNLSAKYTSVPDNILISTSIRCHRVSEFLVWIECCHAAYNSFTPVCDGLSKNIMFISKETISIEICIKARCTWHTSNFQYTTHNKIGCS